MGKFAVNKKHNDTLEFFHHEYFNILPVSAPVDINLTIRIPQMAHSWKQRGN